MEEQTNSGLEKLGDFLNRRPGFIIVFYTAAYFALTIPSAALKPFWYDELFTWATATRTSFAEVLNVLRQGWDLQPPFYFLLERGGRALADSELGFRMPSLAGTWLGSLFLYLHLRRLIPPVFAASALFLPGATMIAPLTVEARPYALLFCFASAALFFWGESLIPSRRWPVAGLFLSLVAVSTVHYYGFLAFVPLGAGELVHALMRRGIRWRVWGLMALACVPAALHWPLIHASMTSFSSGAWNAPHLSLLTQIYSPGRNNILIGLLALALAALISRRRGDAPATLPVEIAVAWTVTILTPAIGLAIAFAISGMIVERYALFWHSGVIAALLYCVSRLTHRNARAGAMVLGLAVSFFLGMEGRELRQSAQDRREMNRAITEAKGLLAQPRFQTLPLVVTNTFLAFQLYYYAPQSIRERMIYVADVDLQPPGSPPYTMDLFLPLLGDRGFPWRVRRAQEFYSRASSFLLSYEEMWGDPAIVRVREHGCSFVPTGSWNGKTLFLVEHCN